MKTRLTGAIERESTTKRPRTQTTLLAAALGVALSVGLLVLAHRHRHTRAAHTRAAHGTYDAPSRWVVESTPPRRDRVSSPSHVASMRE